MEEIRFLSNFNDSQTFSGDILRCSSSAVFSSKTNWVTKKYLPLITPDKDIKIIPQSTHKNNLARIATIPERGFYIITLKVESTSSHPEDVSLELLASNPTGCLSTGELPLLYTHLSLLVLISCYIVALLLISMSKLDDGTMPRIAVVVTLGFLLAFHSVSFANFNSVNHCIAPSFSLEIAGFCLDDISKTLTRFLLLLLFGGIAEKHYSEFAKISLISTVYLATQLSYDLVSEMTQNLALTQAMLFICIIGEVWMAVCVFKSILSSQNSVVISGTDVNLQKTSQVVKIAGILTTVTVSAVICAGLDYCNTGWHLLWFWPAFRYSLRFGVIASIGVIYRHKEEAYKTGELFFFS